MSIRPSVLGFRRDGSLLETGVSRKTGRIGPGYWEVGRRREWVMFGPMQAPIVVLVLVSSLVLFLVLSPISFVSLSRTRRRGPRSPP